MKIIALKGNNGSGKSTIAALIASKLSEKGIDNKVLAFADAPKRSFNKYKGITIDWENREQKELYRKEFKKYCESIKEEFNYNLFVYQIIQELNKLYDFFNKSNIAIVSDLRFLEEYETLMGWCSEDAEKLIVIEIQNTLTPGSEYELDKISSDYVIQFNSNLEEQIDNILKEIL